MPRRPRIVPSLLTLVACLALVAGCASAGAGSSASGGSPIPTAPVAPAATGSPLASAAPTPSGPASTALATVSATPSPATTPGAAAAALAGRAWATATLTDASTGTPFTIASLAGRTVFVEAMAIWCTNCRAQQGRFTEALTRLDPSSVAYVVLTVDPSEGAAALAKYKADRGFSGTYAVTGKAVSTALAADFGANVLNPPSVPLILITPSGEIRFTTGGESVDQIIKLARG